MTRVVRSRSESPVILRAAGSACRVRRWPFDPDVAHLVFFNQARAPQGQHVQRWLHELTALGYTTVRTGAVGNDTARMLERLGFHCVQELTLLEHRSPASVLPVGADGTHRLLVAQRDRAGLVDRAAFAAPWALDAIGVGDVCHATPRHRARGATADTDLVAYAISGRDGRQGFLQRLAVHPDHQREGHGMALVIDSMRWFARWRATRVLVNTHTDNIAALALYHRLGFTTLPDVLRVFEVTPS